ncbi:MAG: FG-GAP-like repeat-containing protein [Gammaproteobacteria bacterium]|nr:FG-GAP-like repeat-containing protein [Gammaproteobacteria bacterium]
MNLQDLRSLDGFPVKGDPRLPVLLLLISYLVLGITLLGFNRSPTQILLAILATCLLDVFFHRALKGRWLIPLSAAISGSSLAILVNYSHGLWLPLIPVFFAIASKYVFTVNGRHVYNPSLFGLVVAIWLGGEMISPAPAYQWGGYPAVAVFIVTAALLLFVLKIRRSALIASFLLFYTLNLALRAWLTRYHVPPETLFFGTLTSPAFYLFAFFMITDPATSPKTPRAQVAMSFAICVIDLMFQQYGSFAALFKAAFVVYSLMFAWQSLAAYRENPGMLKSRLLPAVRNAVIISAIAITAHFAHESTRSLVPGGDTGFRFVRIDTEASGLDAAPGDILQQVDPRLAHVAKWLLSVGDAVAVADVDNDGLLDVFLTYPLKEQSKRAALFLNNGNLTFRRHAMPSLDEFTSDPASHGLPSGALFLDYDNDGDQDLFLQAGYGNSRLLQNRVAEDGQLLFVDTGDTSGIRPYTVSLAANAIDVNRDGLLDILVGNSLDPFLAEYEQETRLNVFRLPAPQYEGDRRMFNIMHRTWHDAANGGENRLYLNRGTAFELADNDDWGLEGKRWTIAIGASDLNDDGYTDLYLANDFGPDQLYLNEGGRRFAEVRGHLVGQPGRDTYKGMNASIADVDGNGYPDIYVSNVHHVLQPEGSLLWLNDGTLGTRGADALRDRATSLNALNEHRFGWGGAVGDLDRDGRIDILQANGMVDDSYDEQYEGCPDYWYWNDKIALTAPSVHGFADRWADLRGRCIFPNELNRVYLNRGSNFVDVAADVGWDEGGVSRGIALADFDNDGDLDALVTHQFEAASLFRNDSENRTWLGLDLQGNARECNRDAVGTRAWLRFPKESGMSNQYREVTSANGFSAQGDSRLLFGLGSYTGPMEIEVAWCGMQRARFPDLAMNRYHKLTQD